MTGKDFFISYSHKDKELAATVKSMLQEKGYSVWDPANDVELGQAWAAAITEAIRNCRCFIALITDAYSESECGMKELSSFFSEINNRGKKLFPFVFSQSLSMKLMFLIGGIHQIKIDLNDSQSLKTAVDNVDKVVGYQLKSELLYEKVLEFSKIKNDNKMAETICELLQLVRGQYDITYKGTSESKQLLQEMYRLYEKLTKFVGAYDEETKKVVHKILKEIDEIKTIISQESYRQELYHIAYAIRMLYFDREIRMECADVITNGDVRNPCPIESYIKKQAEYVAAFDKYYREQKNPLEVLLTYSEEEQSFIKGTEAYIFTNDSPSSAETKAEKKEAVEQNVISPEDEILLSVANFMQEGNKLLDTLRHHGMAGDFVRCLLTSYERLKNYCEVVGANQVASECVEHIVEIRKELERMGDKCSSEKAENGIKSLLGFTIKGSGEYDVFISFKNEDADLAGSIYNHLKKNLIEAFWSKVSLPELSKSDYGDAIDQALDRAKHFVLVISDLDYLEADWVKYEMKTFSDEIREGRKNGSNFVIVATDDVYSQIIESNKMVLPIKYRWCQIIKMSEYESMLMQYMR